MTGQYWQASHYKSQYNTCNRHVFVIENQLWPSYIFPLCFYIINEKGLLRLPNSHVWQFFFFANSQTKIHKILVFLNEISTILDCCAILKTGRWGCRSQFFMDWMIFCGSWGILSKTCIVDTYWKKVLWYILNQKLPTICIPIIFSIISCTLLPQHSIFHDLFSIGFNGKSLGVRKLLVTTEHACHLNYCLTFILFMTVMTPSIDAGLHSMTPQLTWR